jgi:K+-sensing histidine kinase KdpD
VFDRFYRAETTPDRTAGHAGLGLAIVRALVEAQAGSVAAANRPEGGARFTIDLPASDDTGAGGDRGPGALPTVRG